MQYGGIGVFDLTEQEIITAFNEALSDEIAHLMHEGGRPLTVLDGVLIYSGEGGFLYVVELESEVPLLEGAPVRVRAGRRDTHGEVVTVRGCELTLALGDNLGSYLGRAEVYSEPWFLLEALKERLGEVPERNLGLAMRAFSQLPVRARSFVPPTKAVAAQEEAVRMASTREITFIWGPPGTGKTETLARIAQLLNEQGERVLILSHANVAVDGAVLRTASLMGSRAAGGRVLRYGWARLPELRESSWLAVNLAGDLHPNLRDRRRELEGERRYLLTELRAGRQSGRRLQEVELSLREVRALLKEIGVGLARGAEVLGCTLAMAAVDPVVYGEAYDAVLLDEASMAYLPQVFFAASLARRRLVISGDFRQLAPVALASTPAVNRWLKQDIFEQTGITAAFASGKTPEVAILRRQHRMHPAIAGFANDTVYGGLLYNAPGTATRAGLAAAPPFPGASLVLADLSELPALCYRHQGSRYNPLSAVLALILAQQLIQGGLSVGLLTPYAAQARLLNTLAAGLLGPAGARSETEGLTAATIHRFQGAERDAVVLDLVDAFPQRGPGVLLSRREGGAAQRLINVAVTRARGKLVVLAHREFLAGRLPGDAAVRQLFRFIEHNGQLVNGSRLVEGLPDQINGNALKITLHPHRRPALQALDEDLRRAKVVQMDWPAAAGPPARTAVAGLNRALARGARLYLRTGIPASLPPELRPYVATKAGVLAPLTILDRQVLWYGCPWPEDGRVDHFSVRVHSERFCRTMLNLLEFELREKTPAGRYAGFRSYVENNYPCPGCGHALTVRAGGNGYFLGCTAYPRCRQPAQSITIALLEKYLAAAGLACPAGHLLKAVPTAHGPLVLCAHRPSCNCVYHLKDLL